MNRQLFLSQKLLKTIVTPQLHGLCVVKPLERYHQFLSFLHFYPFNDVFDVYIVLLIRHFFLRWFFNVFWSQFRGFTVLKNKTCKSSSPSLIYLQIFSPLPFTYSSRCGVDFFASKSLTAMLKSLVTSSTLL